MKIVNSSHMFYINIKNNFDYQEIFDNILYYINKKHSITDKPILKRTIVDNFFIIKFNKKIAIEQFKIKVNNNEITLVKFKSYYNSILYKTKTIKQILDSYFSSLIFF